MLFQRIEKRERTNTRKTGEQLNVTGRTVSRWENGSNMPDLDVLIEMADFYTVDIRELLDGERKSEKMNKELGETIIKVAEYSTDEKNRLMKILHVFSWIGVLSFTIYIALNYMGLAETGISENIASFCLGISFGMLIIAVIYTSHYIGKFKAFKTRVLQRKL